LRGDLGEAQTLFTEVLATAQRFGMTRHVAYALENLGNVATLQGEQTLAAKRLHEGLCLARDLGDQHLILYLLSDLTKLEVARGHPESAARLGGSVVGLREQLGISMPPAEDEDRDQALGRAREELGTESFDWAWADGYGLTREQAVAFALEQSSTAG
jgi:hypothetical protein